MENVKALEPGALAWRCDPDQFDFTTTADVPDLPGVLGQERAVDAVQFGVGIQRHGYNLYVLGPPGMGKRTIVRQILAERASHSATPSDWCYVFNFDDANQPRVVQLPAGRGSQLRHDMETLVEDLRTEIPAALEIQEHQNRVQEIEQEAKEKHDQAFQQLAEKAQAQSIQLIRTPGGFAMAPVKNGEVIGPEEFEKLTPDDRQRVEKAVAELQAELIAVIQKVPQWRKEARDKIKALNREATQFAISHLLDQIKQRYTDLPAVLGYFDRVQQDILDHADEFHPPDEEPNPLLALRGPSQRAFVRYRVNVLVDNGALSGAPVVFEERPTFQNLLGRIEHESQLGTLVTDFTLIKAGALHRANGGYLLIDVLQLLQQPFAWEGLKGALRARAVKIEALGDALSLINTRSLEPEPIELDIKVVLLGERRLYYLLYHFDPDFAELFKVAADFEPWIDRTPENCRRYAQFIAALARQENLRPLDRSAVARLLEHLARVLEDSERLTVNTRTVADLIREADFWAAQNEAPAITAEFIQQAIDKQVRRADRPRALTIEEIQRRTIFIDTTGARVGQINGLSVVDLGNFRFGQPSRITATTRIGQGRVVDIEREVELGGAIHSKGVLILASFLGARYANTHPLSLAASLVFEQSYGPVDGDSASVAELCALLSCLADAPIGQHLAVTGSINQLGQVQPIGGVNEKVEGFFDVCRARGLAGNQGVLIPAANVKHLMLRRDVIDAAAAGQFHIYAIETIDQAVGLLTGVTAGELGADGCYPPGTINQRVQSRLLDFFELRRKYGTDQEQAERAGT